LEEQSLRMQIGLNGVEARCSESYMCYLCTLVASFAHIHVFVTLFTFS